MEPSAVSDKQPANCENYKAFAVSPARAGLSADRVNPELVLLPVRAKWDK
jgi:hypothetical protein